MYNDVISVNPTGHHRQSTLKLTPNIWETSKREALLRHQFVASMMESLYMMGMDHPAKSTILPVGGTTTDNHDDRNNES